MISANIVRFNNEHPFDTLRFAGVAIQVIGPARFHVGILHRPERGETELLHLAWHYDLRNEIPTNRYAWIQPPYPDMRLRAVAAHCRRVWKTHHVSGLPYGFRYRDSKLLTDGQILHGKTEHGFTCATFVLLLFRAVGIELIDIPSWPARDSDKQWHAEMMHLLREHCSDEATSENIELHLQHLETEQGCARFRPEEVAGAASSDLFPTAFEQACRMGEAIARVLHERA
jgi:hypothetical protein